jgi:hypothetical protein
VSAGAPSSLPLLRSRVQGDVLAWTFLHPEREYGLTDLSRRLGAILRPFDRIRRRRNDVEYPSRERPALTAADVTEDAARIEAILDLVDSHLPD